MPSREAAQIAATRRCAAASASSTTPRLYHGREAAEGNDEEALDGDYRHDDRTVDGRPLKMLTVIDEFSRQCLAITVARRLKADDVLATLAELFMQHGPPADKKLADLVPEPVLFVVNYADGLRANLFTLNGAISAKHSRKAPH